MRLPALIAIVLTLGACSTTTDKVHYAEANTLMRQEIQSRIANIPFQHRQELFNNLLWLATKGGESAIPDLIEATKHKEAKVRSSAAWVLGRVGDRRTIPDLQPLTRDENEAVRFEAARSLVVMGDTKFVPTLIEGLDSEKIPVRYNCHMALRDSSNRDFQYDHLEDDPAERRVAVLRWRQWWSAQSGDALYAKQYAERHGLSMDQDGRGTPARPMTEVKKQPQPQPQPPSSQEQQQQQPQPPQGEPAPSQGQPLPEAGTSTTPPNPVGPPAPGANDQPPAPVPTPGTNKNQ